MALTKEVVEVMAEVVGGHASQLVAGSETTHIIPGGNNGLNKIHMEVKRQTGCVQTVRVDATGERGGAGSSVFLTNPTVVFGGENEHEPDILFMRDVRGDEVLIGPENEVTIHHSPQQLPQSQQRAA